MAHARLLHTPPVRAGRPEGGARAGVCRLPPHRAGTGARPTRHVCAHAQGRSAGLGTHGICLPLPHLPPYFPVPSAPVLARAGQQRAAGEARLGDLTDPAVWPCCGCEPAGRFQRHTRVPPRPVLQAWLATSPPQRLGIAKTGLSLTEGLPAPCSAPPTGLSALPPPHGRGLGRTRGSPRGSDFPDRRDALHAGALTSGDIAGQMSSQARGLSRAWRVSRWVLRRAGSPAAQVLREGSSEGVEAVVFLRGSGPSLGRLRVDGTGHVSEHQPAGPLQRALRGDSGLQGESQGHWGL